ncbi:MAG TPA: hypothetical protein VK966_08610 [Longimicrobiales bacterium]|nr:hypothetical protein [Longimicrobiales bacterium]
MIRWRNGAALLALVVVGAACAPLGGVGWDDILLGGGNRIDGEIRNVDMRRDRLTVRSYRGQRSVRFDNRTVVTYRDRRYRVSALERGDQVRIQLTGNDRRQRARRIEVIRSARDSRRGSWNRTERVNGRVAGVDRRRGWFVVRERRGSLRVYMPRRADRRDERVFQRLRRGDRVRADVELESRGEAVLVRFR